MSAAGLSTSTMRSSAAASSLCELGRAVGGGPEREDQLDRAVDLLREHRLDGAPQVAALVEHRHDEGDAGVVRDDGRVLAPGLVDCIRRSCHARPAGRLKAWDWSRMDVERPQLLRKALANRTAVQDVRRTLAVRPEHPPHHYQVAVYFADGAVNMYQMRQWYKPLAELVEALAGRRAEPLGDGCAGAARRGRAARRLRADRSATSSGSSPTRTSASSCTSTRTPATSRCSATGAAGTCSSTTASPTRCT